MILVPDQYRQGSRKNLETEVQLKQNASKQLFSDPKEILKVNYSWKLNIPKEIWGVNCEDYPFTSGNEETEEEEGLDEEDEEEIFFPDPDEYPEIELAETERRPNAGKWRKSKNVRFENSDFNEGLETSEGSSLENEYPEMNCGYGERKRSLSQGSTMMKDHRLKGVHKPKWRAADNGDDKCERRPKSSPEKTASYFVGGVADRRLVGSAKYGEQMEPRQRTRRKDHGCGRNHGEIDLDHVCGETEEAGCRKQKYKFDCGDDFGRQHHGDCCDYCPGEEDGRKKNQLRGKPMRKHFFCQGKDSPPEDGISKSQHKKVCRPIRPIQSKQSDSFGRFTTTEHHCQQEEYHDHAKSKKKFMESVQDQQEKLSDSIYRMPHSKFSSGQIHVPGESEGKRLSATNSFHGDWFRRSGRNAGEKMSIQPHAMHKLRSRRTRMNRLKNGWKKAFVQTVRDGTRNERVGVLVMGPKGPEFYSKKPTEVEGREKTNSEVGAKSFDVMTVDCKNVYLSSSEPRATACMINELACPEDEIKVDAKLTDFSKNVSKIVKTSDKKFYKSLSSNEYQGKNKISGLFCKENVKGDAEGDEAEAEEEEEEEVEKKIRKSKQEEATVAAAAGEEEKLQNPPLHLHPFEALSPSGMRPMRKQERKTNPESRVTAEALNKKAKEFKENQSDPRGNEVNLYESVKQLQERFPPTEISEDVAKANLSTWGIDRSLLPEAKKDHFEDKNGRGDGNDEKSADRLEKLKTRSPDAELIGKCESKVGVGNQQRNEKSRQEMQERTKSKNGEERGAFEEETMLGHAKTEPIHFWEMNPATKWTQSVAEGKKDGIKRREKESDRKMISKMFRDLVENGCAISREESEDLQNLFMRANAAAGRNRNNSNSNNNNIDFISEVSSGEIANTLNESKGNVSPPSTIEDIKEKERKEDGHFSKGKTEDEKRKDEVRSDDLKNRPEEADLKRMFKLKSHLDEKLFKKIQSRSKKKMGSGEKTKLLREALPSIAAENEATHLKQLKRYIDRFIERVEASTSADCQKPNRNHCGSEESITTDSSEVRVDARRILDVVSSPFKTISSDVTINIAKKLTDALVQEKTVKGHHRRIRSSKCQRKKGPEMETEDEKFPHWGNFLTSGSDRCEDSEPTYLKQLKKMRNEHLNNILLEVKRLSELLRSRSSLGIRVQYPECLNHVSTDFQEVGYKVTISPLRILTAGKVSETFGISGFLDRCNRTSH